MEDFNAATRKLLRAGNALVIQANIEANFSLFEQIVTDCIPEPKEGSPRGIVICSDDQMARSFSEFLEKPFKALDLTLDLIVEKGQRVRQRNDLFFGTELIVGTPKRICEMYFQNGFNIGELKLFMLLDLNTILKQGNKGFVNRLSESLPKCKKVVVETLEREKRITEYIQEFLGRYKAIKDPQLLD
jgi:superfamily II DNA/RNA helicase